MKKTLCILLALVLTLSAFTVSAEDAENIAAGIVNTRQCNEFTGEAVEGLAEGRLSGLIIGIDPGHQRKGNNEKEPSSPKGGEKKAKVSSGTSGRTTGVPEYQTNLEISLILRDALEAEGATVVMTRDTNDVDISNRERALLMNEAGADLVLRIHCNGSTRPTDHGASFYVRSSCAYGRDTVADPQALMDAERRAAKILLEEMCAATGAKNNGVVKRDTYTMNNWSTVPIILVECGYMTNREEDTRLNDPEYQSLIAQGLTSGICNYFER